MKKKVKLMPDRKYGFYLESIGEPDIGLLRMWKNNNRKSFFYQDVITARQQESWFDQYRIRDDDYIFMIKTLDQNSVGCMGFRLQKDKIDIYNVMRGSVSPENVSIWCAMYTMLTYIVQNYDNPVQCDVLKDNPAVDWYRKCGFAILEEKEYYVMGIEKNRIPRMDIVIEEE